MRINENSIAELFKTNKINNQLGFIDGISMRIPLYVEKKIVKIMKSITSYPKINLK